MTVGNGPAYLSRCAGALSLRDLLPQGPSHRTLQLVDLVMRVVERERRPHRRLQSETIHRRLRAMMPGAHGDTVLIEDLAHLLGRESVESQTTSRPPSPAPCRSDARPESGSAPRSHRPAVRARAARRFPSRYVRDNRPPRPVPPRGERRGARLEARRRSAKVLFSNVTR